MAFKMTMKNVKKFVDLKKGYAVFKKDEKNYFEKDGKTIELPSGSISIKDEAVYINDEKLDIKRYL